jgi:hypothetical protein
MYDVETRERMRAQMLAGASLNSLSTASGISRAALRDWRDHPERDIAAFVRRSVCPRCTDAPLAARAYAYLLGLYLGDGCVSSMKKGVYSLRITCDLKYPGIITDASEAICSVKRGANVHLVQSIGCLDVTCLWKHWPCLFPQHGPGPKHTRTIKLVDWQVAIAQEHPGQLLRGTLPL